MNILIIKIRFNEIKVVNAQPFTPQVLNHKKKLYLTLFSVIFFITTILFAGLYITKSTPSCPEVDDLVNKLIKQEEESRALLFTVINKWDENLRNNLNEYIFQVQTYNFGNGLSENVKLRRKVYMGNKDESFDMPARDGGSVEAPIINTTTKTIRKIHPSSYTLTRLTIKRDIQKEGEYPPMAFCSIESCDNCEKLINRIPQKAWMVNYVDDLINESYSQSSRP